MKKPVAPLRKVTKIKDDTTIVLECGHTVVDAAWRKEATRPGQKRGALAHMREYLVRRGGRKRCPQCAEAATVPVAPPPPPLCPRCTGRLAWASMDGKWVCSWPSCFFSVRPGEPLGARKASK